MIIYFLEITKKKIHQMRHHFEIKLCKKMWSSTQQCTKGCSLTNNSEKMNHVIINENDLAFASGLLQGSGYSVSKSSKGEIQDKKNVELSDSELSQRTSTIFVNASRNYITVNVQNGLFANNSSTMNIMGGKSATINRLVRYSNGQWKPYTGLGKISVTYFDENYSQWMTETETFSKNLSYTVIEFVPPHPVVMGDIYCPSNSFVSTNGNHANGSRFWWSRSNVTLCNKNQN